MHTPAKSKPKPRSCMARRRCKSIAARAAVAVAHSPDSVVYWYEAENARLATALMECLPRRPAALVYAAPCRDCIPSRSTRFPHHSCRPAVCRLPSVDPPTHPRTDPASTLSSIHPSIHPRFLRTAPDPAAPALPTLLRVQAERAEVERAAAAATSAPCAECASKERELSRLRQAVLEVQSAHADSETKSREDLDALRMVEALVRSRFTRVWVYIG